MLYLIVGGDSHLAVLHGEAAPKLLGGDVCAVLHRDVLLDGADETPELLLHQLSGNHLSHTTAPGVGVHRHTSPYALQHVDAFMQSLHRSATANVLITYYYYYYSHEPAC